jgi:RNA polymerase sigma-70 factor (ECF subfamily)
VWSVSDEALLAGLAAGDAEASAAFVRRFQSRVYGLALTMLRDRELADDAAQEAFVRAWRYAPSYDARRGAVATWLLSIARNVCADHVRRRRRRAKLLRRLHLESAAMDELVDRGTEVVVDDLVRRLDPDRRDAFVLTQLTGLSYADAAVALDCPIGTIRSRVARARADLLAMVDEAQADSR